VGWIRTVGWYQLVTTVKTSFRRYFGVSGLPIGCLNLCLEYPNVYPKYPGLSIGCDICSKYPSFSVHGTAPPYFGPMDRVSS
jgi:hypothetical protein